MKKILLLLSFSFGIFFLAQAQIYTEPTFPSENDKVTVYFDATKGSGGLKDCNCDVYVHTGVITSAGGGWKYVKMQWGVANPDWKMTKVSANLYKYELAPTVRDYYSVPAGETVKQLAFVFRNANGSAEGKAEGAKDIFFDLNNNNAFVATLVTPSANATILKKSGETIEVKASANQNGKLTLKDNGLVIKEVSDGNELTHTITVTGTDAHQVEFIAEKNGNTVTQSFSYLVYQAVTVQDPPSAARLGAIQSGNDVTLMLNAKNKENVFVIGDFSDWKIKPENLMRQSIDGSKWWIELKNLPNGTFKYQYVVDGNIKIPDPHSEVILDENNDKSIPASSYPDLPSYPSGKTAGYVSILEIPRKAYNWQVTNFKRPERTDLVIYELLLRDFSTQRNMQFAIDSLDYLKKLGVNAIQFMPINEFDNNQSWGYNPTLHHALDKYYASPDIFKKFVDECHKRGIAVILDVVFNHVSEKGPIAQLYPISNSPYVNAVAKHPFNVFLDMNHESPETRAYVDRCLQHWLEEYRIDGYRFDLSKGFTQVDSGSDVGKWGKYDPSRIAILEHYYNIIEQTSKGAYPILEHFGEFKEEKELTDKGMMVWQNANYSFGQAIMGFSGSGLNFTHYLKNGFQYPNAVTYAESHDEERNMYRALNFGNTVGNYSAKDLKTALRRSEAAALFLLGVPGPKMIWQFGELGFDYSINDCGNGTVNNNCRLSIKPSRWDYLEDPDRHRLFDVYRSMIDLKKTQPIFQSTDVTMFTGGNVKQLYLNDNTQKLIGVANFDLTEQIAYVDFPLIGKYYDYFTGDSLNVTALDQTLTLQPGEYRLYTTKKLPQPLGGYKYYTANKEISTQITDFQVYPNPTLLGEDSQIAFSLLQKSAVLLEITDLTGRVIRQIAKGELEAGQYQYTISQDLAVGTYIATLRVGHEVVSKRVLKF